jgi:hypothetical protein
VVTVLDGNGNTASSSSAAVTVAITQSTGTSGALLSGTTTVNAVNGVASFSGLGINLAGSGYTLTATSSGLTAATSNIFTVGARGTKLVFTTAPGGATAGYGVDLRFISDEDWRVGIDTNLTSAFYCTRAVLPHLLKQDGGKIINTASGFGLRGARNNWTYVAAKAGLINFTRSLALTYAENNIQANCIAPGLFPHTEEMARYWRGGKFIPMGRLGRDEELGPLVVFLASPLSDHMTGETIVIDGGGLADGQVPVGLTPVIPL